MYTRETELRDMKTHDLFTLFTILDDNQFWKHLMLIMPKGCNWERLGAQAGRHYNHFHVSLLESVVNELDGMKLSELDQGITLGILLNLLARPDLYRGMYAAVDYLANYLLKEASPGRPSNGPAATIELKPWNEPQHRKTRWQKPIVTVEPLYPNDDLERLLEEQKDNITMVSAHNFSIV